MKTAKKFTAFILCMILLLSTGITCFATSDTSTKDEETGTNRYYFYMPEVWKNKYTSTAGIYWWDGTDACESWPGYKAHETDVKGIYYYDVPKDVYSIIWNNHLDGGMDVNAEIYNYSDQTGNICAEFYFPNEVPAYPEGVESFNGMIYVVDFRNYSSSYWNKTSYMGEWYYYYGNGEYGLTPEKGEVFCKCSYLMEPLEAGEFALLDVNADGDINIKDATIIQKYCAKLIELDEAQIKRADGWQYSGEEGAIVEDVTIRTATRIQKFSAHLLNNSFIYGY